MYKKTVHTRNVTVTLNLTDSLNVTDPALSTNLSAVLHTIQVGVYKHPQVYVQYFNHYEKENYSAY